MEDFFISDMFVGLGLVGLFILLLYMVFFESTPHIRFGKVFVQEYGAAWWNQWPALLICRILGLLAVAVLMLGYVDAFFFKGQHSRLVFSWVASNPFPLFLWVAVSGPFCSVIILQLI